MVITILSDYAPDWTSQCQKWIAMLELLSDKWNSA